jgi:hypothetical protein
MLYYEPLKLGLIPLGRGKKTLQLAGKFVEQDRRDLYGVMYLQTFCTKAVYLIL